MGFVLLAAAGLRAGPPPAAVAGFMGEHCAGCHNDIEKKGDLDLTSLALEPRDQKNFAMWVKVYDRVSNGEMPPKKKPRPEAGDLEKFTSSLSNTLVAAERERLADGGRAT